MLSIRKRLSPLVHSIRVYLTCLTANGLEAAVGVVLTQLSCRCRVVCSTTLTHCPLHPRLPPASHSRRPLCTTATTTRTRKTSHEKVSFSQNTFEDFTSTVHILCLLLKNDTTKYPHQHSDTTTVCVAFLRFSALLRNKSRSYGQLCWSCPRDSATVARTGLVFTLPSQLFWHTSA